MMRDRLRRALSIGVAIALGCVVVVVAGPRLVISFVAAEIADAATEAEEMDALCRANHWVHRGYTPTYSVRCRDAAGAEVRPWEDGGYDRVAAITLRWNTGQEVERRLLSAAPLACVFGE